MKKSNIQKQIKKYVYDTPGVEVTKNYFLIDCAAQPVSGVIIENLIKKHFKIRFTRSYGSILELNY